MRDRVTLLEAKQHAATSNLQRKVKYYGRYEKRGDNRDRAGSSTSGSEDSILGGPGTK